MIVHQLSGDGEMTFGHISEIIPFLERSLRADPMALERMPSPRVFKTHLASKHFSGWQGRYIYVYRNGRDVLISYFNMYRAYVNPALEFPGFFKDFLDGRVQYGSWFQHVSHWRAHSRPGMVLVRYEDLIQDLQRETEKIAAFLGINVPRQKWPRILARCNFTFMRANEQKFAPPSPTWAPELQGEFIRGGATQGWRGLLTEEQVRAFDRVAKTHGLF